MHASLRVSASLVAAVLLSARGAVAAEWHVTPQGSASGDGSMGAPWDLATVAFGGAGVVAPGDTVWIHEGLYGDGGNQPVDFVMYGAPGAPIIVRAAPGERATIDGGVTVSGDYVWLWGLEVTNLGTQRDVTSTAGDPQARLGGVNLYGLGLNAINLIVHNTGHPAIGFWTGPGDGAEVYGCLIFGNGIYDPTLNGAPRGNGTYGQDLAGHSRRIADNISFRNWTEGLDAHSSGQAYVDNFTFEGNIVFDNPVANLSTNTIDPNNGQVGLRILDNCTYRRPTENGKASAIFGYYDDVINEDITMTGNYFVNGSDDDRSIHIKLFRQGTVTNNTVVTDRYFFWWWNGVPNESFVWDANTYYLAGGTGAPFVLGPSSDVANGQDFNDFATWKARTGFDATSSLTNGRPSGLHVCKRRNEYEPERAHLAVYNWDAAPAVPLDLSDLVAAGQTFEIRDAQNYFGPPILTGTYAGGAVDLPMTSTAVAEIRGTYDHWQNQHTGPVFGAFVLRASGELLQPPGSGGGGAGGAPAGSGTGSPTASGAGTGGDDAGTGDGGCDCATPAERASPARAWLLAALACAARLRRRPSARGGARPAT